MSISGILKCELLYAKSLKMLIFQGNYSFLNFPANAVDHPPFVPAGDYRFDFRIFNENNQTIIFPRMYVTIKAKGKNILAMG